MKVRIISSFTVDEIDGKPGKRSFKTNDTPTLSDKFGRLLIDKGLAEEFKKHGGKDDAG